MVDLAKFGSFHVGGRPVTVAGQPTRRIFFADAVPDFEYDPNGDFVIEQAYVQYFVPSRPAMQTPLVLLHGGGLTGAMWETTPDGRPGWLNHFLAWGFTTYVVDNVERGRAGWCSLDGEWDGQPLIRSGQEAWTLFRFGAEGGYGTRTPFDGQRFPTDSFDAFMRGFVPRWTTTGEASHAAFQDVVRRVGPCVVICHSQGGGFGCRAAEALPDLVRGLVAIEPSGLFDGRPSPVSLGGKPVLLMLGDYTDAYPVWQELAGIIRATAADLDAAGARTTLMAAPDDGLAGHSHMPMMDRGSDRVAARLKDWLLDHKAAGCFD